MYTFCWPNYKSISFQIPQVFDGDLLANNFLLFLLASHLNVRKIVCFLFSLLHIPVTVVPHVAVTLVSLQLSCIVPRQVSEVLDHYSWFF